MLLPPFMISAKGLKHFYLFFQLINSAGVVPKRHEIQLLLLSKSQKKQQQMYMRRAMASGAQKHAG